MMWTPAPPRRTTYDSRRQSHEHTQTIPDHRAAERAGRSHRLPRGTERADLDAGTDARCAADVRHRTAVWSSRITSDVRGGGTARASHDERERAADGGGELAKDD